MKAAAYGLGGAIVTLLGGVLSVVFLFGAQAGACGGSTSVAGDVTGLPTAARQFVPTYIAASATYRLGPRGPAVLAAIHHAETDFSQNLSVSSAGAVGPMQFMPGTWSTYGVDADSDGIANPNDATDAIYSAARYLRSSGAPGDWRGAIYAYNHAGWYVDEVLRYAERYGNFADAPAGACGTGGSAALGTGVRLYEPREYIRIPAQYTDGGGERIDARLLPDVIYVARTYHLTITQGLGGAETGSPSVTHGYGTAIDAVPANDYSHRGWVESAQRAAEDLGWSPDCGSSGVRPACDLVPAIWGIFYNGYPGHGEGNHIHIGWICGGCAYDSHVHAPATWVMAFPIGGAGA